MALEIKLNQKLSQTLVMTPQLQQAIKLLQLGRLEYAEVLEKELLENPVLEDGRDYAEAESSNNNAADSKTYSENSPSNENHFDENKIAQLDETQIEQAPLSTTSPDFSDYVEFTENFFSGAANRSYSSEEEWPSIEATVKNPDGLSSHLLWQLRTTDLSEPEFDIAATIVGHLDKNGYLSASIEEIAALCGCSQERVAYVLSIVHTLDPIGIASRDLQECLFIQLSQLGLGESLAGRIVSQHLNHLELQRFDLIAKSEGVAVEEIYEAVKIIRRLEPRPGRPFVDEAPVYITPDVYVQKVEGEYKIQLNDSGMPKLRLSEKYRTLFENTNGENNSDKEYLQDKFRSASWLIKSILQRQQTILKVTESIMRFQNEFLEKGVSGLKPLVLRDVAAEVGMHESTVSRVTTNKYVHTPQGVYELKYFFSSALKSGSGEVSSESVKERIRALIADENPKKPLSDQAIVNQLQQEGVDIARRTVAKYREMMNILSSSRRKQAF